MPKSIIAEGKTTNEAISNGLKELHVSKDKVDIKILESSEKRSFFSILSPRVVKVELTLKENAEKRYDRETRNETRREKGNTENGKKLEPNIRNEVKKEDIESAKEKIECFLQDFLKNFTDIQHTVQYENGHLSVQLTGENASRLIGYRGEALNSLQTILNSIVSKHTEVKIRVILNVGNYKEKREKALQELADKVSKTVLRTGKSVTLEPMIAYERKVIHNRLQQNSRVKTYSVGDEPYRKVVIAKK